MQWQQERIYYHKDKYFADALSDIRLARQSIEVETYIWEPGKIGDAIVTELKAAAARGVRVRFIVDSFGSLFCLPKLAEAFHDTSVTVKVYHSLYLWKSITSGTFRFKHLQAFFARMNKRLHRKMILIDGAIAYTGGFNILDVSDRDTGVRVVGDIAVLRAAFDKIWGRPRDVSEGQLQHPLVRLNATRHLRRLKNLDLAVHLRAAKERIWITNAYFVPPLFVLKSLFVARQHNVDVRLMISAKPDHLYMRWVMKTFYRSLLRHGVRIFEYQSRFLHAKSLIVDDWVTVGSSNFNHRSIMHDLEVDIILVDKDTLRSLHEQFLLDQKKSVEIIEADVKGLGVVSWVLDGTVQLFKYWM